MAPIYRAYDGFDQRMWEVEAPTVAHALAQRRPEGNTVLENVRSNDGYVVDENRDVVYDSQDDDS